MLDSVSPTLWATLGAREKAEVNKEEGDVHGMFKALSLLILPAVPHTLTT